jgi:NAD-dependent SIR2 family protein deacetylase
MAVVKHFPPQAGLQLVRHDDLQVFTCSRCSGEKKSKLVAHRVAQPEKPLCNGCYGLLLSKGDQS